MWLWSLCVLSNIHVESNRLSRLTRIEIRTRSASAAAGAATAPHQQQVRSGGEGRGVRGAQGREGRERVEAVLHPSHTTNEEQWNSAHSERNQQPNQHCGLRSQEGGSGRERTNGVPFSTLHLCVTLAVMLRWERLAHIAFVVPLSRSRRSDVLSAPPLLSLSSFSHQRRSPFHCSSLTTSPSPSSPLSSSPSSSPSARHESEREAVFAAAVV